MAVRPDVPRHATPLFTLSVDDSAPVKPQETKPEDVSEDGLKKELDDSEDTNGDLLTDFVPLLISMKVLAIGLSNCEDSGGSPKKLRPCSVSFSGAWRISMILVVLAYTCYFMVQRCQIFLAGQHSVTLDVVSNAVTIVSALVTYISIYRSASSLGAMLRKLAEHTLEGAEHKKPIFNTGSRIFFLAFGFWSLQGVAVVSKLSRCHSEAFRTDYDEAAADCLRGNDTLCSSPSTVFNIAQLTVRYAVLRGIVWISMLFAYYALVSVRYRLKQLNLSIFHLPTKQVTAEAIRYVRRSHSVFCRMIKVMDASFGTCVIFWYFHCVTEILSCTDQFIDFSIEDIWCVPFKSTVGLNVVCLFAMMVAVAEAAHSVSANAKGTIVILAQRSAELPTYQPEFYEHINAVLNSFRSEAASIRCCKMWALDRAFGWLAIFCTTIGLVGLLYLRPQSRHYLEAYFTL